MKAQPFVSIIIVGWNNYEELVNCLDSLKTIAYQNYNIVLVDNNSEKDSLETLTKWLSKNKQDPLVLKYPFTKGEKTITTSEKLVLVYNKENGGFAGGNNIGAEVAFLIADPDYLLLLNGDTLATPDFLNQLVATAETNKEIGSVQSVLLRFDEQTVDSLGIEMKGIRIFDSSGDMNRKILEGFDKNHEIFGACAASALYRVDMIKKIGLFDFDFFSIFEDVDLAWRIRLAGYSSVLCSASIVYHRGGISRTRIGYSIFGLKSYYSSRNIIAIFVRYYPLKIKYLLLVVLKLVTGYISAMRAKKSRDFLEVFCSFLLERKKTGQNNNLLRLQKKWLK